METAAEKYLRTHSTAQSEALAWVEHQTNIRTHYPQMLSGAVQGRFLTMMVEFMAAGNILEIGTFTGYSSICMAYGLGEGGHIDSLEINDELEDLIMEAYRRAGVEEKISLHIGDAKETLAKLKGPYDMAYIDADKREYCEYYEAVINLIRPGGCILADDVLWNGKLFGETLPQDKRSTGISGFNDLVVSDPRVEVAILPIRDGLSVIRKLP